MLGNGKYGDALQSVLKEEGAKQGVLIVIDGEKGIGFSCTAYGETLIKLPNILEKLAEQIRADNQVIGL